MITGLVADTKSSILFLSRLRLSASRRDDPPGDFRRSAYAFPIAGLVIALPAALTMWLADLCGLAPIFVSLVCVAISIIVTGALHEDGLADTVDGFWGGHTRERKLEIMRDSATGTYGIVAMVLTLLFRVMAYAVLIERLGGGNAALVVLACAGLSRMAILQPWTILPAARADGDDGSDASAKQASGLSIRYGTPDSNTLFLGLIASVPAAALLLFASGLAGSLVALVLFEASIVIVVKLSRHHIQGHSGDVLGATQQLSELGLLLGLVWTM